MLMVTSIEFYDADWLWCLVVMAVTIERKVTINGKLDFNYGNFRRILDADWLNWQIGEKTVVCMWIPSVGSKTRGSEIKIKTKIKIEVKIHSSRSRSRSDMSEIKIKTTRPCLIMNKKGKEMETDLDFGCLIFRPTMSVHTLF